MSKPIKIKSLTQTCEACPSQWQGKTHDGQDLYIRFRWGYLSVRVHPTNAVQGPEVFGLEIGDNDLNGLLTTSELRRATDGILVFP